MKLRLVIQILLITVVIAASSSMLFKTDAADVYTTTVTDRYTTTLTSRITETLTMTSDSYTTETETTVTVIETQRVIMTSQTVIVQTTVIIPPGTTAVTTCWNIVNQQEPGPMVRTCITKLIPWRADPVTTYVPAIIIKPTTVTSWITSYNTVTETETISREERSPTTRTELLTLTLENIYTLLYTSTEASLPQNTTGLDVSAIISNNLTLLLIAIILILIAALAIRLIRPRIPRYVSEAYCVSCGKPIERGVKHCPQCGASQK